MKGNGGGKKGGNGPLCPCAEILAPNVPLIEGPELSLCCCHHCIGEVSEPAREQLEIDLIFEPAVCTFSWLNPQGRHEESVYGPAVIMISPHQRYSCRWVKESDAVAMYLETSFYETLFPKGMTEVSLSLPVASQDLALWRVANAMCDIYGAHNPGESRTLLLLGAALSHHVVELLHHTMPEPVRRLADDLVRKVEEFVTARMGHPIQAKDIANHVGYSVPHFTNLFKAATGITPAEYLFRRRMKKADELLRTGAFTIGQAGEKVGYSDQGHFAEIFLDHWGYSPRHAIQQARVESANRPKIS